MPFIFRRGSFAVRDHLRSNLVIISGLGIICGRGSFAALYISYSWIPSLRALVCRSLLPDVSDKELNTLCKIHAGVPSFEDCLLFRLHTKE